ncbi:MAG: outer membrane beta-barrel protein [Sediminibacterium sp.]|nr:outer membrane beta-barrel protein [Sediminibacterium sp.]MDP3567268.1 outer membrane beta-barrel protein [Sediminibacterium sp.]
MRGVIKDSALKMNINNASVVLLNAKDSIILSDVRTSSNGSFVFSELYNNRNYILFISYPGYLSISKEINIGQIKSIDLGSIILTSKEVLLKEVVVKSSIRSIQLRGDTLQYNTAEIQLPPNASVEDLLKILPGLQVDPNGKISAQGKKVKRVLVDGEEFFSDDPVFVTRNLRSEMVAKVQVYDKKSDAAIFTGIDDGIKDKVINLQLKQDKSNGVFGKVEAGIGLGDQFTPNSAQAMINSFKGKRKTSGYTASNNIGQSELGATEKNQLGVKNDLEQYDGKGLPQFSMVGLHFDNKWNKDRNSFNGDYYYSISNVAGFDSTFSNTILPVGAIKRFANTDFQKEGFSHKMNFTYKQEVGERGTITFSHTASYNKGASSQQSASSDLNSNEQFLNRTNNQTNVNSEGRRIQTSFLFQQKFKQPGRTISFSIEQQSTSSNEQQTSLTATEFFNGKPSLDSTRSLDLFKGKDQNLQNLKIGLSFSNKINNSFSFILSANSVYDAVNDNNLSNRIFNPNGSIDSLFSTIRNDSRTIFIGNLSFNFVKNKVSASLGSGGGTNRLFLNNLIQRKEFERSFAVWKPFARVQYSISDNTNFGISYRGTTVAPGFQELSPYAFNNDQLVTFSDNLSINNAFSNKVSLTYESFKSLTKAFTGLVVSHNSTKNPIKLLSNINTSGAYFLQYVNMAGYTDEEFELTGFYSKSIPSLKIQATIDLSGKSGKNFSFINGALNKLIYNIASAGILLSKNKSGKYAIQLGSTIYYDVNSLNERTKITRNNFFSYKLKSAIDVYLSSSLQIHSDAEFFRQGKNNIFTDNFDRMVWNAWISKSFLKNNLFTVKLTANDILNSNAGFSRVATSAMFSENRYLAIRRYFMLSAIWNFTKYKQIK